LTPRVLRIPLSLRLPVELHERVKAAARESGRSVNAEIVWRLRRSFDGWRQV